MSYEKIGIGGCSNDCFPLSATPSRSVQSPWSLCLPKDLKSPPFAAPQSSMTPSVVGGRLWLAITTVRHQDIGWEGHFTIINRGPDRFAALIDGSDFRDPDRSVPALFPPQSTDTIFVQLALFIFHSRLQGNSCLFQSGAIKAIIGVLSLYF